MLRAASVVALAAVSLAGGRGSIEHHDAVRRRLQYTTGTYIPGTYSMVYTNGYTCTWTVTEDGKVEVCNPSAYGWDSSAELLENDTGEYEDYPYKITGGSYKWELARFSTDPNNPSKAILDVRHYNPSFCCAGSGSSYVGGCALYIAGPVVASHGNQVATVDSLQNYELSFTMELASDWSIIGNWQSVIHIGNTDGERFPGIWFQRDSPRLTVFQHESASWNDHYSAGDVVPASGAFEAGETYDIKVIVESNQMAVYVDDVNRGTASGSATWYAADMGVYVGSGVSWWPTAKVTLSDITLSEIALADVCRESIVATTTTTTVPCATPAVPVESSLIFTVGSQICCAAGINGHLYVKLWSGTTPIPMSSTVSVSAIYPGSCDTNDYQDDILDNWSGGSGWLKLDDIDVSTTGATSSQSLGSLDLTLPLTHIELYYTEDNALQVGDLSIQVGDTSYGLPASWSNANHPSGDGWLETDQSCAWWMEIEMVWLDGPVGGPPCGGPRDDDDSNNDSLAGILGGVGAILVVGIFIFAMMKHSKPVKPAPAAAPPVHEPTALPQPALASIKGRALEMMELASPPPQMAEAIQLPPGHVHKSILISSLLEFPK